ncbi:WG repeat-containing protein [Ferruginibacter sp.]
MKQAIFVLLVAFLFSCQQKKTGISLELIPVKQGEYWGYIDKAGKMVINPQFRHAYTFSDGLAMVENTEGKYGFIDKKGTLVILPMYVDALSFSEGLAAVVREDQQLEFIDVNGKTVITPDASIETARSFHEGLAMVEVNGKKSFIDRSGKIVFGCPFEYVYSFQNGLAKIEMKIKDSIKYGFIDKTGKIAINPIYNEVSPFFEDRAGIFVNNKYGFIDNNGKTVIDPQFEDENYFSEGLAAVKQGDLWGFIGKDGKFVINPQFKDVRQFTASGLCAVKNTSSDKWGFIDKTGKVVIEPQFETVTAFYDDVAVSKLDTKYGVIGKDGKYLVNPVYEYYEIEQQPFKGYIKNDHFEISTIATPLFRDLTSTAVRGIDKNTTFTGLQSKFPGITHENYEHLKSVPDETNISMTLEEINFLFNEGFVKTSGGYKTEQQYNPTTGTYETVTVPDTETKTYDDYVPLKAMSYNYRLMGKAKTKALSIIKELKPKLPASFTVENPDTSTYILTGANYSLAVVQEEENIHLVVSFDKSLMDMFRKPKDKPHPAVAADPAYSAADSLKK